MKTERTRYHEFTPWNGVVHAVLWGVVLLSSYPILAGWDGDVAPHLRLPIVGGIVAITGALVWAVGGLTVRVQESRVVMHLGRWPLIRSSIPFEDIISLRSIEYRPLGEFGGWGMRGLGKRRAWSARGNLAVALRLTGDREVLIGSDHPKRLEERIRTLAGISLHD